MNFRAGIFKVNKPHREFFQAISKTLTDVYIAYNFIIWIAVICISPKGAIFFRRTRSCIPYACYILNKTHFFWDRVFFSNFKKNFFWRHIQILVDSSLQGRLSYNNTPLIKWGMVPPPSAPLPSFLKYRKFIKGLHKLLEWPSLSRIKNSIKSNKVQHILRHIHYATMQKLCKIAALYGQEIQCKSHKGNP